MKFCVLLLSLGPMCTAAEIRLGIIGTDTSHVIAFTEMLNNPTSPDYVPGARVVAAYKGGSPDVESSYKRVDKFAEELSTKWKVELVSDIATLCRKVDGVLLESGDGRVHLAQIKPVIAAGKPVFIDKPLASTLDDAREIARLAKQAGVPWFSASSLRFAEIATSLKFPDITSAITWGPGPLEPHHQLDLSWYAIHAVELLYTLMGTGCEEVTRTYTPDSDVVVGKWKGGRLGTVQALRPYGHFGAVVFRPEEKVNQSDPKATDSYHPLVVEIIKFFETKQPPFPNEETLEIFAFMDAAQRSKEAGGAPMKLR
ncbi:MAG TPA: Gfo/Idh/MocA family oxidoreductase [Bryobacteraceae bacterium]|nr:Gfo/Idh/MocA family oxidoreductase [Bryobacteraceae bacterium]